MLISCAFWIISTGFIGVYVFKSSRKNDRLTEIERYIEDDLGGRAKVIEAFFCDHCMFGQ